MLFAKILKTSNAQAGTSDAKMGLKKALGLVLVVAFLFFIILVNTARDETPSYPDTPTATQETHAKQRETTTLTQTTAGNRTTQQEHSPPAQPQVQPTPTRGEDQKTSTTTGTSLQITPSLAPPPHFIVEVNASSIILPKGLEVPIELHVKPQHGYTGTVKPVFLGLWQSRGEALLPGSLLEGRGIDVTVEFLPEEIAPPGSIVARVRLGEDYSYWVAPLKLLLGVVDEENKLLQTLALDLYPLKYPSYTVYVDSPLIPPEQGQMVVYPLKVEPIGPYDRRVKLSVLLDSKYQGLDVWIENGTGTPPFTAYLYINASSKFQLSWGHWIIVEVRDENAPTGMIKTALVLHLGTGKPTRGLLSQLLDTLAVVTLPFRFTLSLGLWATLGSVATPITLDPKAHLGATFSLLTPELLTRRPLAIEARYTGVVDGKPINYYRTAFLSDSVPAMAIPVEEEMVFPCSGEVAVPFLLYVREDLDPGELEIVAYSVPGRVGEVRVNWDSWPPIGVAFLNTTPGTSLPVVIELKLKSEGRKLGTITVKAKTTRCLALPPRLELVALPGYNMVVPIDIRLEKPMHLRTVYNPINPNITATLVRHGPLEDPPLNRSNAHLLIMVDESTQPGLYRSKGPGDFVRPEYRDPGGKWRTLLPVAIVVLEEKRLS